MSASIGCSVRVLTPRQACFCLDFCCPSHEAPSVYMALCSMRHCLTLQGSAVNKGKDGPTSAGAWQSGPLSRGVHTAVFQVNEAYRQDHLDSRPAFLRWKANSTDTGSPADTKSEGGHQPPSCGAHFLMTLLLWSVTQRTVCAHRHVLWRWLQPPGSGYSCLSSLAVSNLSIACNKDLDTRMTQGFQSPHERRGFLQG